MSNYKYVEDGKEYECTQIGGLVIPLKPLEPEEPTHDIDNAFTALAESAASYIAIDNKDWGRAALVLLMLLGVHALLYTFGSDGTPNILLLAFGVTNAMFIYSMWMRITFLHLRPLAVLFQAFAQKVTQFETSNPADKRVAMLKRLALCVHDAAFNELRHREGLAPRKG